MPAPRNPSQTPGHAENGEKFPSKKSFAQSARPNHEILLENLARLAG